MDFSNEAVSFNRGNVSNFSLELATSFKMPGVVARPVSFVYDTIDIPPLNFSGSLVLLSSDQTLGAGGGSGYYDSNGTGAGGPPDATNQGGTGGGGGPGDSSGDGVAQPSIEQMILNGTIGSTPDVLAQATLDTTFGREIVNSGSEFLNTDLGRLLNSVAGDLTGVNLQAGMNDLQKRLSAANPMTRDNLTKASAISLTLATSENDANIVIDQNGKVVCRKIPELGDTSISIFLEPDPQHPLNSSTDTQRSALGDLTTKLVAALSKQTSSGVDAPSIDKSISSITSQDSPPPPLPPAGGGNGGGGGGGGGGNGGGGGGPSAGGGAYPSGETPPVRNYPQPGLTPNIPSNPFITPANEPSISGENANLLAIKDMTAGLYNNGAGYSSVGDRGAEGYGVGRFDFTAASIMSWIDSLDLTEFDDAEEDDQSDADKTSSSQATQPKNGKGDNSGKTGKNGSAGTHAKHKVFPKGTKAKLKSIQDALHKFEKDHAGSFSSQKDAELAFLKTSTSDPSIKSSLSPDAVQFLDLANKMQNRDGSLKAAGQNDKNPLIDQSFGAALQEQMADDLLNQYAGAYMKDHGNSLDLSAAAPDLALSLFAGKYLSDQDERSYATANNLTLGTADQFNQASKARDNQLQSGALIDGLGGDPLQYMVTQFGSALNPNYNEGAHNENCGPSSTLTALRRYLPQFRNIPADQIQSAIQSIAVESNNTWPYDPATGSQFSDLAAVINRHGLHASVDDTSRIPFDQQFQQIDKFFGQHPNGTYILLGHPQGIWDGQSGYVSAGGGDHIVSVLSESADGSTFVIADPLLPHPFTVSRAQLMQYAQNCAYQRVIGIEVSPPGG